MAQKYGVFDTDGKPEGFWADDVYSADQIPKAAIPITDEQWQTLLSRCDATWDGEKVIVPPMQPLGGGDA